MHNKVVYRLGARAAAVRFGGAAFQLPRSGRAARASHAHGAGEVEDARAALDWLRERYPELPVSLAGFSFGSRVVLRLGCEMEAPRRVIALGFPTRQSENVEFLNRCPRPKYFIQSTHDEHGPREQLERLFAGFAEPKRLIWVEATDHFFAGGLDRLEDEVFRLGA